MYEVHTRSGGKKQKQHAHQGKGDQRGTRRKLEPQTDFKMLKMTDISNKSAVEIHDRLDKTRPKVKS